MDSKGGPIITLKKGPSLVSIAYRNGNPDGNLKANEFSLEIDELPTLKFDLSSNLKGNKNSCFYIDILEFSRDAHALSSVNMTDSNILKHMLARKMFGHLKSKCSATRSQNVRPPCGKVPSSVFGMKSRGRDGSQEATGDRTTDGPGATDFATQGARV